MPFSLFNTSRKDQKAGAFSWASGTAQQSAAEPAEAGATVGPAPARTDASALAAFAASRVDLPVPVPRTDAQPTAADKPAITPPEITRPAVAACLKYVIDPEVGINIVDLGLVYDLRVEMPSISLTLTMTTPACPMSGHIRRQAYAVLERIRGVEAVEVDLVWEPAWTPQMMDRNVGRTHFGGR